MQVSFFFFFLLKNCFEIWKLKNVECECSGKKSVLVILSYGIVQK